MNKELQKNYRSPEFNTFLQALTYVTIWRQNIAEARDYLDVIYKQNPKSWGPLLRTKIKLYKGIHL